MRELILICGSFFIVSCCAMESGDKNTGDVKLTKIVMGDELNKQNNQQKMLHFSQDTLSLLQDIPEDTLKGLLVAAHQLQPHNGALPLFSNNEPQPQNNNTSNNVVHDQSTIPMHAFQNPIFNGGLDFVHQGYARISQDDHEKIQRGVQDAVHKVQDTLNKKIPHRNFTYTTTANSTGHMIIGIIFFVIYLYNTYFKVVPQGGTCTCSHNQTNP